MIIGPNYEPTSIMVGSIYGPALIMAGSIFGPEVLIFKDNYRDRVHNGITIA